MQGRNVWLQVLLILALLAPLLVLLMLPAGSGFSGSLWFWLILLMFIFMFFTLFAAPFQQRTAGGPDETGPRMLFPEEQPSLVQELMDVRVAMQEAGVRVFRGRLKESGDKAYRDLKEKLPPDVVPLVQPDEELGSATILMPHRVEQETLERPTRVWLNWLLFGLTFLTTTWAGALHQGVNLLSRPEEFALGLPYSIGLLLILGVHELGHYFTARRHGMRVTPPYFIPVPFALGTFGAFIQMKSPPENRLRFV